MAWRRIWGRLRHVRVACSRDHRCQVSYFVPLQHQWWQSFFGDAKVMRVSASLDVTTKHANASMELDLSKFQIFVVQWSRIHSCKLFWGKGNDQTRECQPYVKDNCQKERWCCFPNIMILVLFAIGHQSHCIISLSADGSLINKSCATPERM